MEAMKQDTINGGRRLSAFEAKAQLLANTRKGGSARVALRAYLAEASEEARSLAPHLAPRARGKVRAL